MLSKGGRKGYDTTTGTSNRHTDDNGGTEFTIIGIYDTSVICTRTRREGMI